MDTGLFKRAKEVFRMDIRHSFDWFWPHNYHLESSEFHNLILKLIESIIENNPKDVLGKSVNNFLKTSCVFWRKKFLDKVCTRLYAKIFYK